MTESCHTNLEPRLVVPLLRYAVAQREAELDGLGSFSAIMRPSMGTPVRVRVLDECGGELKAIDL
jgi:hypothetical protein